MFNSIKSDENRNLPNNPFLIDQQQYSNKKPFENQVNGGSNLLLENGTTNNNYEQSSNIVNNNVALDNKRSSIEQNVQQNPFFQPIVNESPISPAVMNMNTKPDINSIQNRFNNIQIQSRPPTLDQQSFSGIMPSSILNPIQQTLTTSQANIAPPPKIQPPSLSPMTQQPPLQPFPIRSMMQPPPVPQTTISQQQSSMHMPQLRPPLPPPSAEVAAMSQSPPIIFPPKPLSHQFPTRPQMPSIPPQQMHARPTMPSPQEPLAPYNNQFTHNTLNSAAPRMPQMPQPPLLTQPMKSYSGQMPDSRYPAMNQPKPESHPQQFSTNYPPQPNHYQQQQQQQQPLPPPQLHQQHQPSYSENFQGSMPQYPPYEHQSQRKLDIDQLPSPLQVMEEDQEIHNSEFCTNQRGLVPPLVTTEFVFKDGGNAHPKFIRSTMYTIPNNKDMQKQACVPFALVISPMSILTDDDRSMPLIDCRQMNPVRCNRCKGYMSPNMQFIDAGHRFQCQMCKVVTDVDTSYFQHLDHTGYRVDRYQRPELMYGSYEFLVGKEYYSRTPKPPAYLFLIDVSYNNIKSGLVHLICKEMKRILHYLPTEEPEEKSSIRVGFVTYNNSVHFYNLKETLSQPQMHIVSDVHDVFMPLIDGFLCDVEKSSDLIDALMLEIPRIFGNTQETETALLPAMKAGLEALKAYECPGKLIVLQSSLPISNIPGQLKTRDERKLLATDKEKTVLTPQTLAYNELGQECVEFGCCVDLFLTNNSYIDIASIGQVSKLTGGEIRKYTYFQADIDGERLISDLEMNIRKPIAFDAIMRIRTSTGIHPSNFYGHFFMRNPTEVEFAAIDCDKAIAVEIDYDDKLSENDGVVIQVAMLYTSVGGHRKVRIHNLALNVSTDICEVFRCCELNTLMNYFSKQAVYRLLENNCKFVTEGLFNRCAHILAAYRKFCTKSSATGQLILPDSMKLLPLYLCCLLKNDVISGGADITLDDKSFLIHYVLTMDVFLSVSYLYPRLFALHECIENGNDIKCQPPMLRCQYSKVQDNGIYLLENGIYMFIWVGSNVSQILLQKIFGVNTFNQIQDNLNDLPDLKNNISNFLYEFILAIREEKNCHMRLTVVKQHGKLETVFNLYLVEDRGREQSQNYVDFLCNIHKEIRLILG